MLNMEINLKRLKINILQGFGEVGGNCITLNDKDNTLVFDQGIRFSRFRKYYNANVQPGGPSEMEKLHIVPDVQEYKTFFISHLHLDHLGLLHRLNPDTTVYVPNNDVFDAFIEPYKNANNWTTYVSPSIGVTVKDVRSNNENVIPIPVSHSAYPAYSLYYDNGDDRVLYTGDLRISSLLKSIDENYYNRTHNKTLLEEYEEKGYDTDVLIIEGTNFSSPTSPLNPYDFTAQVSTIFQNHSNSLIFFSVDPIDLESILSILLLTKERTFVVSGKRLIKMLRFWIDYFNLNFNVYQLSSEDLEFPEITEDEIKSNPQNYVILIAKGEYLDTFRRNELDTAPVLVSLSTEARSETGEDESVEDRWLRMLGFIAYRLRISGHYYPYELKYILDTIRPKKIVPIHTKSPKTLCEYAKKLGYNCLLSGS